MHDEDGDQILFGDISVHWGCLKIHWAGILQHYMCSSLESGFLLFLLHWMVYNLKTHMMSLVLKIDLTSCSIRAARETRAETDEAEKNKNFQNHIEMLEVKALLTISSQNETNINIRPTIFSGGIFDVTNLFLI